jgi:hypothetical protein
VLSRDESRAWAEIERHLLRDLRGKPLSLSWIRSGVPAQTLAPLLLAAVAAVLGLVVPAFLLLFVTPVGLVVHMARVRPPRAARGSSPTGGGAG